MVSNCPLSMSLIFYFVPKVWYIMLYTSNINDRATRTALKTYYE